MQALVKKAKGPDNVRLCMVPEPQPGPHDVIATVSYAGICGSDLHILHDRIGLNLRPPVVMGHEFVGRIVQLGTQVTGWSQGDRVVAETAFSVCGECVPCRSGHDNVCARKELIGYVHNGAFAPLLRLPARRLHAPPAHVSDEEAVLSEPLAGCVHGLLEQCRVRAGDLVVIAGAGAVGLISMLVAASAGATTLLLGRSDHRLDVGRALGADHVLNVSESDVRSFVSEITQGRGCDVFVEAAGSPDALRLGLEIVSRRGRILQQGLLGQHASLDVDQIAYKELLVTGTMGQKWTAWQHAMRLLASNAVSLRGLTSHVFPLGEWRKAFSVAEARTGIKVLLNPQV